MAELGRAGLVLCLGLSAYAVVVGGWAVATKRRRLAVSHENALVAAFGCVLVATAVLATALLTRDFSFVYVARLTSDELPVGYTLSAFWGGQEGSLLLWLFVLTGYSALVVFFGRRRHRTCSVGDADPRRRCVVLLVPARRDREPVRDPARAGERFGLTPACRTRTCSPTRRSSTSATSA